MHAKTAVMWAALCALSPAGLAGCDDESTGGSATGAGAGTSSGAVHDVDEHACEHLRDGPFAEVTAAAAPADAPDVSAEHTAYRIALPAEGAGGAGGQSAAGGAGGAPAPGRGGVVSYAADAAAHFVFFLDVDLPFSVADADGGAIAVVESCDRTACSDSCPEIAGRHVVELDVGTYYLTLGPSSASQVTLVCEEEGHVH